MDLGDGIFLGGRCLEIDEAFRRGDLDVILNFKFGCIIFFLWIFTWQAFMTTWIYMDFELDFSFFFLHVNLRGHDDP